MKQDTKRFSSIVIAVLIIVAALVVYFEFIVPAYATLETTKGQEESEQTLYGNEQQIVTQAQALLANYESESSSSQSVGLALPVGQDVSGALAQIYGIGASTGVTVQNTAISVQAVQSPTPSDGSDGQIASAATTGSITKPLGTVTLQINGSGSYEAFKAFLQGLQTNIRLFDVSAISLQPAGAGIADQDLFNYSVTVVTYYQAP